MFWKLIRNFGVSHVNSVCAANMSIVIWSYSETYNLMEINEPQL